MNAYAWAAELLLRESGCTVRAVRSSMVGRAHVGSDTWEIEAPIPRGPVSFGILAHEVAHHLLHRVGSRPRWVEEVEAEEWALAQYARLGLAGHDRYQRNAVQHVAYAFAKAIRRSPRLVEVIPARFPQWWALATAEAFAAFSHSFVADQPVHAPADGIRVRTTTAKGGA